MPEMKPIPVREHWLLTDEPLIAFLATTDAALAKAFYGNTLGLQLVEEGPYALEFDAVGTMLRIQKVPKLVPAPYTSLGWRVPDIARTVRELAGRGVAFERYAGLVQDSIGIWRSPSGALIAWFKDPDGNTLSLTQVPPPPR